MKGQENRQDDQNPNNNLRHTLLKCQDLLGPAAMSLGPRIIILGNNNCYIDKGIRYLSILPPDL